MRAIDPSLPPERVYRRDDGECQDRRRHHAADNWCRDAEKLIGAAVFG
jgi:hypothetical protein